MAINTPIPSTNIETPPVVNPYKLKQMEGMLQGVQQGSAQVAAAQKSKEEEEGANLRAFMQGQNAKDVEKMREEGQTSRQNTELGAKSASQKSSQDAAQKLEKLKSSLQGASQAKAKKLVDDYIKENPDMSATATPEGFSAKQDMAPMKQLQMEAAQGGKVASAQQKTFKDMEEGMQALNMARGILQNPTSKNLPDLKAMSVKLQGLPARAFGAEAKSSGFDLEGFDALMKKINTWNGKETSNPLTDNDLNALRSHIEMMATGMQSKYKAANEKFWSSDAPTIAPLLDKNGKLDSMRAAHEKYIQDAFGNAASGPAPWVPKPGVNGAPAVPAPAPTAPPPTPNGNQSGTSSFMQGIRSLLGGGGQQQPPQQPPPPKILPQAPPPPPQGAIPGGWNPDDYLKSGK